MAIKRSPGREGWPVGLYEVRKGYFIYRSSLSGRNVTLGAITEKDAIEYAAWANSAKDKVLDDEKIERVRKPHLDIDDKGLLNVKHIAEKAMVFDKIIGVYFLLQDNEIVYVGQSTSILTRLANHSIEATKKFNRVYVVECPAASMTRLERMYIDKLKPIYNASCPPVGDDLPAWTENTRALLRGSIHSMV